MDFKTIKDEIIKHPEGGKMLSAAFTHRSFASENNLDYDTQRLEFLGDAVLELILRAHLFKLYPDAKEGAMTAMRSALVREETLANLARHLKLGQMLKIGRGERELQGNKRNSTLAISLKLCLEPAIWSADMKSQKKSCSSFSTSIIPTLKMPSSSSTPKVCFRSLLKASGI